MGFPAPDFLRLTRVTTAYYDTKFPIFSTPVFVLPLPKSFHHAFQQTSRACSFVPQLCRQCLPASTWLGIMCAEVRQNLVLQGPSGSPSYCRCRREWVL